MKDKDDFTRCVRFTISFVCLLLAGCTTNDGLALEQVTALPTVPLVSPSMSTNAITSTQIPSATPTMLQSSTPTPRPSRTPRPTYTVGPPTVTPLPTIPPADVPDYVRNLFETNGGCQLPCWWGIVPGQTTWADARNFLSTFADELTVGGAGQQRAAHTIVIPKPEGADLDGRPAEFWQQYIVSSHGGIVLMIRIGFGAERYLLPELLATFGPPDEVWIRTYSSYDPFYVVVSYPRQGIVARYLVPNSLADDLLIGCPQYIGEEPYEPELWLMSPEESVTIFELLDLFGFDREGAANFLSLEEATGMDVETFYEVLKDPNNTECLTTPLDLWP